MSLQGDDRRRMIRLSYRWLGICALALLPCTLAAADAAETATETATGVASASEPEPAAANDATAEATSAPAEAEQPVPAETEGASVTGADSAVAESTDDRSQRVRSAVAEALAASEDEDSAEAAPETGAETPAGDQDPVDARRQQLTNLVDQAPEPALVDDEAYLDVLRSEVADTLVLHPAMPADAAPAPADAAPAPADEPLEGAQPGDEVASSAYQVRSGDSLWIIAAEHLGDGNKWKLIYEANRDTLEDENFLRVGQVLKLPDR